MIVETNLEFQVYYFCQYKVSISNIPAIMPCVADVFVVQKELNLCKL